jgi:cytochrome b561
VTTRKRFTAPQRFLHWLMAVCILSMLFIGVGMVSTATAKYLTLVQIHKPLGIAILILALIRLVFRVVYGAPDLPPDLPALIRFGAESSQYVLYALMIVMPLLGWAMLSAASYPVVLFGSVHLPSIAPLNPTLHTILWRAHYFLAFAFFATILMHVAAILFHKLIRNDGIFETMVPVSEQHPSESGQALDQGWLPLAC